MQTNLLKIVDGEEGTFQDYTGHCSAVTDVVVGPSMLASVAGDGVLLWRVNYSQ